MMFSTISPSAADEELVESMAKRVVECLKEPNTSSVRVGGWSGIGRRRVMDHVAAAFLCDQKKNKGDDDDDDDYFCCCCCVRVTFKSYIEYEIRKKIEKVLKMDLLGGGDIYWREICMALKWKPLVVVLDNAKQGLDERALGIPEFVTDAQGVRHSFLKLVFTSSSLYRDMSYADKEFKYELGDLPDDVALQMILYEARSSAMSTVKEFLPDVIRRNFESRKEEMTSMMLPDLALLHDNFFGIMLTAECVIQYLFSSMLFFFSSQGCPLYYLSSEILSHPAYCFDDNNNELLLLINSWEMKLLLEALSLDLQERHFMIFYQKDRTIHILPDVYRKLAALASSSSSSSSSSVGIMTQFQGYLVRRSRSLRRLDMAEWSQDLTRISFFDGWIKEVLLPPPSAAAPANFPNISTLILRKNEQLEEIPDDVFLYMPNLRILDLSYCSSIGTLPSSLSSLCYLRMLYLQGCIELQTIETTGLDNLEVLDLDDCPLPTLHKASWCHMRSLKRFSFRNGLTSLGELQLSLKSVKVFDNFDEDLSLVPTADTLKKYNISILYPKEEEEEEIRRRRTRDAHLRTSDTKFPYKDIHAAQVDHRRIIDIVEYPIVAAAGVDDPHEKCLEINGGEGLWSLYTLSLMFRPRLLSLHNYHHAQAGIWPIPELQTCYIKYCSDMEYAFNSPERRNDLWNLKCLETLWISSLTKLSAICDNMFEQQNESFLLLKSIYIEYCPNLLVLFPAAVRLPSLEVMEIKFCARLGKLFAQQYNTAAGEIVLPRLKMLRLFGLPELTSICDGEGGDRLPSLQKLEVRGCWNLKNVPIFPSTCSSSDDDVAAAKVVVVRGEEGWWKNVQGGGLKKKLNRIDFRMGFAAAAPKHIPQRWKRGRRRRRRFPLSV